MDTMDQSLLGLHQTLLRMVGAPALDINNYHRATHNDIHDTTLLGTQPVLLGGLDKL